MPGEESVLPVGGTLIDHEKRLGTAEGEIKLIKNKMVNYEQIAQMMVNSMDDLKKTVTSGHAEQMRFLQDVVKHDQGLESVKMEFEQKMATLKAEQEAKAAEAEREQRIENKQITWKAIRQFALYFAPTLTILVTLINEWLQNL